MAVKNFPVDTPFVFDNKINITGNISKDENKRLANGLENYWDDSMYAHKVQRFGVFYVLKNPPIFDTNNLARTQVFMSGYLNSQGYYSPLFTNIDSSYTFDTVVKADKKQIRTTVSLDIDVGKSTIIDSFSYNLGDRFLDSVARKNTDKSLIKPGKTVFTTQVISSELDRLVNLFRQKGFFLLTRDNLYAEADTLDASLLEITFDPVAQAQQIIEANEKRNQNPIATIDFKNRQITDSTQTDDDSDFYKRYRIDRIYYYPETGRYEVPDSLMQDTASFNAYRQNNFTMFYKKHLFKFRTLREHTYQHLGGIYIEDNFYKTLNNFNRIGAWERVDYRTVVHNDSIDFHYFLTPAKKETISINLEASRSTGDIISSSNLFGLSINTSYINRNVWHRAIQSSTTLSNGVEFSFLNNSSLLQTLQSSISQTYIFPRLLTPLRIEKANRLDGLRTLVNVNASYSDRKDFFRLRSLVGGIAYEWRNKNRTWQYKPLNIELYSLDTLPLLESAFISNPFLRTSFNTGSVVSQQLSFNTTFPAKKNNNTSNYIRVAVEEAGGLLGRIKGLQDNIYQYIKLEAEYRRLINFPKTALAFRALGGIGYNYSQNEKFGKTLPFFKQFVAGGPNSMRAWGLRMLGLGSSIVSDTSSTFRDRYGDMQLEANAEYRFTLAQFSSVKVGGALFTDVGNIWNIKGKDVSPESKFLFSRLGKDIAIGVGTGIRLDFNYFLIRVDFGIKLKDPARYENNGWLNFSNFTWKNYEYAEKNVSPRNNYAVQLGIGLPF